MIRTAITMITVVIMTVIFGTAAILVGVINPYSRLIYFCGWIWSKLILYAAGARISVEGLENLDPRSNYVFISNHQSHIDVPALFSVIKNTVRFFTKKELFTIPIFGWAIKAVGMIKIDRSNHEQALKSMNTAVDTIKHGVSVVVFPEGTRGADGKLQTFKKGGFVIAIKGKIPVVPVSISGSGLIHKKHTLRISPGTVKIKFGQPIPTTGFTYESREKLIETTRKIIEQNLDQEIIGRMVANLH